MNTIDTPTPRNRSHAWRIAGVCTAAALVLGGGVYAVTSAAFTDQETITGNTVGAATLQIGDTVATPVNVTDLLPGQNATGEDVVTFKNTGTVPFAYTVTIDAATATGGPTELLGWIPVTISNGTTTATGTLAAPPTLDGGTTAIEGTGAIDVTVGLDTAADNTAQGKTATFDLLVTATQVAPN